MVINSLQAPSTFPGPHTEEEEGGYTRSQREYELADYYRLANAYYLDQQYSRSLYFMESYNLIEPSFELTHRPPTTQNHNNYDGGALGAGTSNQRGPSKQQRRPPPPAASPPKGLNFESDKQEQRQRQERTRSPTNYLPFTLLAAQCLYALERWDDVVELTAAILGHDDEEDVVNTKYSSSTGGGSSWRYLTSHTSRVLRHHPVLSKLIAQATQSTENERKSTVFKQITNLVPWQRICGIAAQGMHDPPDSKLTELAGPYDLTISLLCLVRAEAHLIAHASASKTALTGTGDSTASKQENNALGISADGTAAKIWAIASALVDPSSIDAVELLTEHFLLSSNEEKVLGDLLEYLLSTDAHDDEEGTQNNSGSIESLLSEPPTRKLRSSRQSQQESYDTLACQQKGKHCYTHLESTCQQVVAQLYRTMLNKVSDRSSDFLCGGMNVDIPTVQYDLSRNITKLFQPFEELVRPLVGKVRSHALRTNTDIVSAAVKHKQV